MKVIKIKSPGLAWREATDLVLKKGKEIKDGEESLLEVINVSFDIENPNRVDSIIKKYGDRKMIEWMKNNFLNDDPVSSWGYSYGQRLNNFSGVDQLDRITKKLKKDKNSKSATLNFMYPPGDKKHVPCVVALDLKIRNNKLIGTTFVRSQDAAKKLYADILALGEVMSKVAKRRKVKVGSLLMHTVSLHVYQADIKELKKGKNSLLGQVK